MVAKCVLAIQKQNTDLCRKVEKKHSKMVQVCDNNNHVHDTVKRHTNTNDDIQCNHLFRWNTNFSRL